MMLRSGRSLGGVGGGLSHGCNIPNHSIPNTTVYSTATNFGATTSNSFQSLLYPDNMKPTSLASPSPDLLSCGRVFSSQPNLIETTSAGGVPIFQPHPVQLPAAPSNGDNDCGLSMEGNAPSLGNAMDPQTYDVAEQLQNEAVGTSKDKKEGSNTKYVDSNYATSIARARRFAKREDGKANTRLMSPGEILGVHTPDFPGQAIRVEDPARGDASNCYSDAPCVVAHARGRSSSARRSGTTGGSLRRDRSSQSF
ncbi:unnamed protein product [Amoebophrya sp. A25]|nr:unnamed protein product [Amoebophrya sp. A25]|eukprot:GSA25T00021394001.1